MWFMISCQYGLMMVSSVSIDDFFCLLDTQHYLDSLLWNCSRLSVCVSICLCDPCNPSLRSLENICPAQIHCADLKSVVFFLLCCYLFSKWNIFLYFSLFRSCSFQFFFSCVLLSLSSTFFLSPLSFFAYPLLSFSFCLFLCLSSTFFLAAFYLSPWLSLFII